VKRNGRTLAYLDTGIYVLFTHVSEITLVNKAHPCRGTGSHTELYQDTIYCIAGNIDRK